MATPNFTSAVRAAAGDTQRSIGWYRQKIANFGKPGAMDLIRDGRRSGGPSFGTLNMFFYDPKHKKTLPYYDTFPLILPIGGAAGGFLGLNLHYLPIPMRVRLLDRITEDKTSRSSRMYDSNTSIITDYSKLKDIPIIKPTIKHYLYGHVKSEFRIVIPEEWVIAALLPVQRFKKASASRAYNDSKRKMI